MVTTNPNKVEDAYEHLAKMGADLEGGGGANPQATMWFATKSLRLLKLIPENVMLSANRLLKAGAYADAALLLRPPAGTIIAGLIEDRTGYRVVVHWSSFTEASKARTMGAAILAAFIRVYIHQKDTQSGQQRG